MRSSCCRLGVVSAASRCSRMFSAPGAGASHQRTSPSPELNTAAAMFVERGDASALLPSCTAAAPRLPPFGSLGFSMSSGSKPKPFLEPRTGVEYPAESCFKKGHCPVVVGAGPRTKRIAGIKSLDSECGGCRRRMPRPGPQRPAASTAAAAQAIARAPPGSRLAAWRCVAPLQSMPWASTSTRARPGAPSTASSRVRLLTACQGTRGSGTVRWVGALRRPMQGSRSTAVLGPGHTAAAAAGRAGWQSLPDRALAAGARHTRPAPWGLSIPFHSAELVRADGVEKTLRIVITSRMITRDKFLHALAERLEAPLKKARTPWPACQPAGLAALAGGWAPWHGTLFGCSRRLRWSSGLNNLTRRRWTVY
jgi:hypothetical protein